MNYLDLLNNLPSYLLLVINEILKESARTGKTPQELLESAGLQIAKNEQKAQELIERLRG